MTTAQGKGIGSAIHDAHSFIFEKNKRITGIVGAVLILVLTVSVFAWEASSKDDVNGREDILNIIRTIQGGGGSFVDIPGLSGFEEMTETITANRDLAVGQTQDVPVTANEDKVVRSINVTLTWSDENDIRRIRLYENQPDTFSVSILDPEGKVLDEGSASNPRNGEGSISLSFVMDDETLLEFMGKGDLSVSVTLTDSGDYEARLGGRFLPINDGSNGFNLSVEVVFYQGPVSD